VTTTSAYAAQEDTMQTATHVDAKRRAGTARKTRRNPLMRVVGTQRHDFDGWHVPLRMPRIDDFWCEVTDSTPRHRRRYALTGYDEEGEVVSFGFECATLRIARGAAQRWLYTEPVALVAIDRLDKDRVPHLAETWAEDELL